MNGRIPGWSRILFWRERGLCNPLLEYRSMMDLLDLEQERANRNGERFSVVLFETLGRSPVITGAYQSLLDLLRLRMRRTDSVGWIKDRLAVLLLNTDVDGATSFTNSILSDLPKDYEFDYSLYVYPTDSSNPMILTMTQGDLLSVRNRDDASSSVTVKTPSPPPSDRVKGGRESAACAADALLPREGSERRPANQPHSEGYSNRLTSAPHAPHPIAQLLCQSIRWDKRLLDILGASILLLATLPPMLLTALLVQLQDLGPVIYQQRRLGYQGKPFNMYKLRTMRRDASVSSHSDYLRNLITNNGTLTKLDVKGDARILPGMSIIRCVGIDELPQLINVLRGEMSLVGPRPCLDYEEKNFAPWQRERFKVRPGLTGLWQVSGKNGTSFRRMMELDLRYAKEGTLISDLFILLRTPFAVLKYVRNL